MQNQVVELHFPAFGSSLPSDHAYPLFAALSDQIPDLHDADWIGIHSMKGRKIRPGEIQLPKSPVLKMRLTPDKIPTLLHLAGARLNVKGHSLRLGIPRVRPLRAAGALQSRVVTVKVAEGKQLDSDIDSFLEAVRRQLKALEISADVDLEHNGCEGDEHRYARRVVRIKDLPIVGYGVILSGLSADDSLTVQSRGIGGRRKFGCGLFVPVGKGDDRV